MEKNKSKRKWYFRFLKKLTKIRYKKPTFIYLGKEIETSGVILCNHEGTDSPMTFEIYSNKPVRFWGAHEMNSGLIKMYKYQSRVYFHEKKHWNLFLARLFCLIASPLTNLFYSGLNLISTYKDARFAKTLKESVSALKDGNNIMIFPEKSDDGYKEILDGFFGGFIMLGEYALKNQIDVPIYIAYFNKNNKVFLIDKPVLFSELKKQDLSKEELAKKLCSRCNALGKLTYSGEFLKEHNVKEK